MISLKKNLSFMFLSISKCLAELTFTRKMLKWSETFLNALINSNRQLRTRKLNLGHENSCAYLGKTNAIPRAQRWSKVFLASLSIIQIQDAGFPQGTCQGIDSSKMYWRIPVALTVRFPVWNFHSSIFVLNVWINDVGIFEKCILNLSEEDQ